MFANFCIARKCMLPACMLLVSLTVTVNAHAAGLGQSGADFNPSIGLVLNGTYSQLSNDPDNYRLSGFPLAEESAPGTRGFSIGESELDVSANIDPNWYGAFNFAIGSDGETEIENAYVQSTALSHGFTLRAGRFFSGIGYLNEQHAHTWDFADTALAYRALLGTQYGDDGVQLRWLAQTELLTEVGIEWFNGSMFPAGGNADNGRGAWTGFIHLGGDINASHSWRAGLSYLSAKAMERESDDPDKPNLFTGTGKLAIADFVWKWAPNGNPYTHNFKFQAEYLQSDNQGDFTLAGFDAMPYASTPSGWYAQAVYQFMPRWRVGMRHDKLQADNPGAAFADTVLDNGNHNPNRNSIMLDFANSEFSLLRLQYNRDESGPVADNQWFIQYTMSMGAHGAHIF